MEQNELLQTILNKQDDMESQISKIPAIEARLDGIEAQTSKIPTIEARLDGVEARLDTIDGKLDTMEGKQDALSADVSRLSHNIEPLLKTILEAIAGLQERYDRFDKVEATQEEHGHRIWALEQAIKAE